MLLRIIDLVFRWFWYPPAHVIPMLMAVGTLGIVASTGVSAWINRRYGMHERSLPAFSMSAAFLAFCLFDWALLNALPSLRLSFSTHILIPLMAALSVRLVLLWAQTGTAIVAKWLRRARPAHPQVLTLAFLVFNLAFCTLQVDAYVIEPLWVETSSLTVVSDKLNSMAPPVRIVHLTDTHIERSSYREEEIVRRVNALQPDIIVLTGDYLNLSYMYRDESAEDFRRLINRLQAPYGKYAVRGSIEGWRDQAYMEWLFDGTGVVWLEQESRTVNVRGQSVTLIGVACSHRQQTDRLRLSRALVGVPDGAFTVLLYHSPDLIEAAAAHGIDLYLAGHTHGGQLRLPFYGAIVTSSVYGKRYEAGDYTLGGTRLYVSRGLGFEGGGMPRARFLCRPEIVSIELRGE